MAYTKKPVNPKAPSNNKVWTKNDDSILKEMANNGSSTAQIAIALGRTKASVWGRKWGLGIKGRLASSKGTGIAAPISISSKKRREETLVKVKTQNIKTTIKEKSPKRSSVKSEGFDFNALSRLAKESGAKIVITFE
jgi:hypothetical protein